MYVYLFALLLFEGYAFDCGALNVSYLWLMFAEAPLILTILYVELPLLMLFSSLDNSSLLFLCAIVFCNAYLALPRSTFFFFLYCFRLFGIDALFCPTWLLTDKALVFKMEDSWVSMPPFLVGWMLLFLTFPGIFCCLVLIPLAELCLLYTVFLPDYIESIFFLLFSLSLWVMLWWLFCSILWSFRSGSDNSFERLPLCWFNY